MAPLAIMSMLMSGGPGRSSGKVGKSGESEVQILSSKRKEWAANRRVGKSIPKGFQKDDDLLQRATGSVCKIRK
jgi:hypothetical protein